MESKIPIFRVSGLINEDLLVRFQSFCKYAASINAETVIVIIMSIGGDLGIASKIVETMRSTPIGFTTIAYHIVHSAAIPIYAAGGLRIAKGNRDTFLFHETTIKNNLVTEEQRLQSQNNVIEYIAEIIQTDLQKIQNLIFKKTYVTALEAKEINLVNHLIP